MILLLAGRKFVFFFLLSDANEVAIGVRKCGIPPKLLSVTRRLAHGQVANRSLLGRAGANFLLMGELYSLTVNDNYFCKILHVLSGDPNLQ